MAARTPQRRQHAFQARDFGFDVLAFAAAGDDRLLDRHGLAVVAACEHRDLPRVALVGRVELHEQARVLARDGPGPALEARP